MAKSRWQINPQRVQDLVQYTHNRARRHKSLQTALGWSGDLSNLGSYLKRHGLTAPWQIRSMRIDPQKIQALIERTRTALKQSKLCVRLLPADFIPTNCRYLRRHGLTAPWQHKSGVSAPGRPRQRELLTGLNFNMVKHTGGERSPSTQCPASVIPRADGRLSGQVATPKVRRHTLPLGLFRQAGGNVVETVRV